MPNRVDFRFGKQKRAAFITSSFFISWKPSSKSRSFGHLSRMYACARELKLDSNALSGEPQGLRFPGLGSRTSCRSCSRAADFKQFHAVDLP